MYKESGSCGFQCLVKHGLHVCVRWPHNGRCSRHAAASRPRPRQSSGGPRPELQRPPPQPSGGTVRVMQVPRIIFPMTIPKPSTNFIERVHTWKTIRINDHSLHLLGCMKQIKMLRTLRPRMMTACLNSWPSSPYQAE